MIKKCVVCGKDFDAKQKTFIVCSAECRKIRKHDVNLKLSHEYYLDHREAVLLYHRRKRELSPVIVPCRICGENVPFDGIGRKHYHAECVLNDAIERFKELGKWDQVDGRIHRAINYGYTKSEVMELMQEE